MQRGQTGERVVPWRPDEGDGSECVDEWEKTVENNLAGGHCQEDVTLKSYAGIIVDACAHLLVGEMLHVAQAAG